MPLLRSVRGQASVELVALLPLIAAGLLACIQVVLVAYAAWSAHAAARSAARAAAVGASALAAARRSLPPAFEHRVTVDTPDGSGRVAVRLRVPSLVPALSLGAITAHAGFPSQR